ncbi:MAG: hypothetical protein R2831_05920 [Chitinophagaceae bacterium]
MNAFILKIIIFLIPITLLLLALCFFANGYTDPFYVRFTTPTQQNLIVGTSRAAQGLQPDIFEKILGIKLYNYSFTVAHSPYGKKYWESILKKHNKKKHGVFIVTVDPWSISTWCKNPNDETQFRENTLAVANTHNVSMYPNIEYLYKNLKGHYKDILLAPTKKLFLHENGWLEVKDIKMDSASMNKRIAEKITKYRTDHQPKTKFSKVRLDYLLQTIKYFNNYGQVYLVRLPVHSEMIKIENEIMPNFNDVISNAIHLSKAYLDMTNDNDKFLYTDGNHLYQTSGREVSEIVAQWIKSNN